MRVMARSSSTRPFQICGLVARSAREMRVDLGAPLVRERPRPRLEAQVEASIGMTGMLIRPCVAQARARGQASIVPSVTTTAPPPIDAPVSLPPRNRQRQLDQARPAHLVALLDAHRVLAVGRAAMRRQQAGERRRRRAGRRILRRRRRRREHARVELMARLRGLAAEHDRPPRPSAPNAAVQARRIDAQRAIASSAAHRHEREGRCPPTSAPARIRRSRYRRRTRPSAAAIAASAPGPALGRQPRQLERGAAADRRRSWLDPAAHRADALLEHDRACRRRRRCGRAAPRCRPSDGRRTAVPKPA